MRTHLSKHATARTLSATKCMPKKLTPSKVELTEEKERQFIMKAAREASKDAIKETFLLGGSIMTIQDGFIVKKYSDGKTETVRKMNKMPVNPTKRTYQL